MLRAEKQAPGAIGEAPREARNITNLPGIPESSENNSFSVCGNLEFAFWVWVLWPKDPSGFF
ncbi:MAG TPA: hypothetical protein DCX79_15140, partial [Planctomycetaceae bacterium]|nr:hypothetical protein [Planctomycetaceae bacterium]